MALLMKISQAGARGVNRVQEREGREWMHDRGGDGKTKKKRRMEENAKKQMVTFVKMDLFTNKCFSVSTSAPQ